MTLYDRFVDCISGPWETGGDHIQFRIVKDEEKNVSIYFQGTDATDFRDILNDIDFPIMLYRDEPEKWYVHRGFARGFNSVKDIIAERIKDAKTIYITGYSAGGAYATLMHEWVKFNMPDIYVRTYTFAAPRVLYYPPKKIKDRFIGLTRVYDFRDIVPHLPPWCLGYTHVSGMDIRVGKLGFYSWKRHLHTEYLKTLEGI